MIMFTQAKSHVPFEAYNHTNRNHPLPLYLFLTAILEAETVRSSDTFLFFSKRGFKTFVQQKNLKK